ncbi:hypothetical protein RPMA_14465 [Tardiphaga alba]|uniref:Uncharacterized protein n=1 Tax=Tardiphaga alba TaxID=340268 RepID=A0ABX8AB70_9BRAD|nr:hypothetical protein [Tardiphaga alba]QUS39904.1 hypothetical protein RPMA_14465 [Tardiphaga alba]
MAQSKPITGELPILSVAAEMVIAAKADALDQKSEGYIARLRRATASFASIIGDKRISEHSPLDVQTYATSLGLLCRRAGRRTQGYASRISQPVSRGLEGDPSDVRA